MKKVMTIFGAILFASIIFTSCGGSSSKEPAATVEEKFSTTDFSPNKTFEFHQSSIVTECKDPTIRKVTVIDDRTAKIYLWYKGCPNNRIEEDELIYNYRIDEATNWSQEYDWLKTDPKVIILENENAGYYNGHSHLAKRYMITNAYNEKKFIETRIFEQLDPKEYPSRDGVFTSAGAISLK